MHFPFNPFKAKVPKSSCALCSTGVLSTSIVGSKTQSPSTLWLLLGFIQYRLRGRTRMHQVAYGPMVIQPDKGNSMKTPRVSASMDGFPVENNIFSACHV